MDASSSEIVKITPVRVSGNILMENSASFHHATKALDLTNHQVVDQHEDMVEGLELWLKVFHGTLKNEHRHLSVLTLQSFWDAAGLSQKYVFDLKKLSVWFALWLGEQDPQTIDTGEMEKVRELCTAFDHAKGREIFTLLLAERHGAQHPGIHPAFKLFPPVPAMSYRQSTRCILAIGDVEPEDYEKWGFSNRFLAVYGEVMEHYSDFERLMKTSFDLGILPSYKNFTVLTQSSSTFLRFCRAVDNKASLHNLPTVTRPQMEAAWTFLAFNLFDKMRVPGHFSERAAAELKDVMRMRFLPDQKIERYWRERQEKAGWDAQLIQKMADGCAEPPEQQTMAEPDEDDEMGEEAKDEDIRVLNRGMNDIEVDDEDDDDDDDDDDDMTREEAIRRLLSLEKSRPEWVPQQHPK
ncbi:uncharacterized protein L3040_004344 [Drepanopeziza brunnea f. sp. 'multigermtubi']|uniref:uncharacterized protein n=1 Tax=Drepanopeziza brunnea f. sp. 'multigermtubi' TaxID=698441 RepID=UPI0023931837|nr:hypothetical protein L3040_004344 [Drepanopeziza brunnea f. sp. 'multigermtubi']